MRGGGIGSAHQVLVGGGGNKEFCEKLPGASPVSKRANATSSGMLLPLAKAEPSGDSGSTSG